MKNDKTFGIVGPGVMAEAIIVGLIKNKVVDVHEIIAAGPNLERLRKLESKYQIQSNLDNAAAVQGADVVILSVKPQKLPEVLADLHGKIPPKALVMSIVAGATLNSLVIGLDHTLVVRAMPNTPAQVGEGMTVWTQSPQTTGEQH